MPGTQTPGTETFEDLLDELVGAIELRECGDPDGRDWSVEARIRRLEQRLLTEHRIRPGRALRVARTGRTVEPPYLGAAQAR
jgi:hypothetical protein